MACHVAERAEIPLPHPHKQWFQLQVAADFRACLTCLTLHMDLAEALVAAVGLESQESQDKCVDYKCDKSKI